MSSQQVEQMPLMEVQAHYRDVLNLLLLDDGTLLSCGDDSRIKRWSITNGELKLLQTYERHKNGFLEDLLWFNKDHFASCGNDGKIIIWNTSVNYDNTGCLETEPKVIETPGVPVISILLLKSRPSVLVSGGVRDISMWEVESGRLLATMKGHTGWVATLCELQPNGDEGGGDDNNKNLLVSGSHDSDIKVWDLDTQQCIRTLSGHFDYVHRVLELSDGTIVSCSSDMTLKRWNAHSGLCITTFKGHHDEVWGFTKLERGSANNMNYHHELLCSASWDGTVRVWDAASGHNIVTVLVSEAVYCVVELKNKRIAVGTRSGKIEVYDNPHRPSMSLLERCCEASTRSYTKAQLKAILPEELYEMCSVYY